MPELPPLPNEPAARTPDGTLLDASRPSPTPTTTSTPTEPSTNDPATTAAPPATPALPERYEFKSASGEPVNATLVDAATPVFRELGLTQPQADKLFSFYNDHIAKPQSEQTLNAIREAGQRWEAETKSDPELGPNLDKIKLDIGRALDIAMTPAERAKFVATVDQTALGFNPEMIRAFWKMAQRVSPGTHITGAGPSPEGQTAPGKSTRPSIASAIYGNLKAS